MADEKNTQNVELTAEDRAIIDAIVEEETNAKLEDIQDYIDSGDLDKDIALDKAKQAKEDEA